MRTESGVSKSVIFGVLAVMVCIAIYMIIGGLSPSGAPIADLPVSQPANPQRNF